MTRWADAFVFRLPKSYNHWGIIVVFLEVYLTGAATSVPSSCLYGRKKSGRFVRIVRKIQGCGRSAVMPNLRAAYEIF
jgi:hypothetical protein